MSDVSDADLTDRCRSGDEAAFTEIVDRYKNLVFGGISEVVLDRSRVADLAQDVFLKIYRGLPSFRGDAKLLTWIYRIVINACSEGRTRTVRSMSRTETIGSGISRRRLTARSPISSCGISSRRLSRSCRNNGGR